MAEICNEKLIALVREYPLLYDPKHPKFKNAWIRQTLWKVIGQEMQTDAFKCRDRWFGLLRSLRSSEDSSGKGAKKAKLFKYAKHMSFIKRLDNKNEAKRNSPRQLDVVKEDVGNRSDDITSETTSLPKERDPNTSQHNLTLENHEETGEVAMATSSDVMIMSSPQSVDAFLAGVAPTLKELTPFLLHQAKAEIFSVVHKYERKMIFRVQAMK